MAEQLPNRVTEFRIFAALKVLYTFMFEDLSPLCTLVPQRGCGGEGFDNPKPENGDHLNREQQ